MVFDKNLAIIESIQQWQEGKKEGRVWNSKVSVFSGKETQKLESISMEEDEVCVSMCYCTVTENGQSTNYLVLGSVKNLKYHPNLQLSQPKIKTYVWDSKEGKASLFH